MSASYVVSIVMLMCGVTFLIRSTPYLLPGRVRSSLLARRLAQSLPIAILATFIIQMIAAVPEQNVPHHIPEIASVGTVVITYVWKKNVLLSVTFGTLVFMVMRTL